MSQSPDLCIVGAGALGIALALHARRLGASVVLVRRDGGEGGDDGSAAIKLSALAASAGLAEKLRRAAQMGLVPEARKASPKAVAARAEAVEARQAIEDHEAILRARGIEILKGEVFFTGPRSLVVGEAVVKPGAIILACGSKSVAPPIEGIDQVPFFTPETLLDNSRKLTHLVVIGGGEAAFEMAQIQHRLGAEVTLVTQGEALPGYDREAANVLLRSLEAEGLRIVSDARVTKIVPRAQGTGVIVEKGQGETEALDVSHILVATGSAVDWRDLDPAKARLTPSKEGKGLVHGPLGQTSNRSIRLVGAAAGIEDWPAAYAHGRAVVEHLVLGHGARLAILPRMVTTEPALVQLGTIGAEGKASGLSGKILRANLGENARLAAEGQPGGLIKLATDKRDLIVGAAIVAPEAGEIAGMLALAMSKHLCLRDLVTMPAPRPSLAAALQELADDSLPTRSPSPKLKLGRALRAATSWR